MRNLVAALAMVLVGCGGGDSPVTPDAEVPDAIVVVPDAEVPDAEVPDAEVPDAIPPCEKCDTGYVFDTLQVPTSPGEAEQLGFDLDGDGTIDNQIGNIFSALGSVGALFDLQATTTLAVDRGDILNLAAIQDCGAEQCLYTFHGSNPMPAPCLDPDVPTTCRQHLDGTGQFTIDPPTDLSIPGLLAGGTFTGGPGQAAIELVIGGSAAAELELIGARADLTGVTETTVGGGKLGGAIPDAQVQADLIPAMHAPIAAAIAADCSGSPGNCTCTPDSTAETLLGIFDDNDDCTVPLAELQASSLIMTLFRPDVDTDGDDVADALSVGFGLTAVGATFTN